MFIISVRSLRVCECVDRRRQFVLYLPICAEVALRTYVSVCVKERKMWPAWSKVGVRRLSKNEHHHQRDNINNNKQNSNAKRNGNNNIISLLYIVSCFGLLVGRLVGDCRGPGSSLGEDAVVLVMLFRGSGRRNAWECGNALREPFLVVAASPPCARPV